jgi:cytochrome c biogenesis protein CcdA
MEKQYGLKRKVKMKLLKLLLVFLVILSLFTVVSADETCAYFFYGEGCPACGQVKPYIEELNQQPEINIQTFEIYQNKDNLLLLHEFYDAYNVPTNSRGVPTVLINGKYLVGYKPIIDNFETEIANNLGVACPSVDGGTATGITGQADPTEKFGGLSILTVAGAALVDSINPCAIAVLLILLSALLATGEKKRALKAGIAFTISIYISYFLFGLGLFKVIQISGVSYSFYKVVGFLAIIIGIFNIKDGIKHGALGFVMEIPLSWRPTLKKLLKKVTSPLGAFFMGFIVCLFELPCTGGPYIVILGLLAQKTTQMAAIPILLFYNLVFILPLLIITYLVFRGFTTIESADRWKQKNIRKLHLVAGIVMIALGAVIVSGLI